MSPARRYFSKHAARRPAIVCYWTAPRMFDVQTGKETRFYTMWDLARLGTVSDEEIAYAVLNKRQEPGKGTLEGEKAA